MRKAKVTTFERPVRLSPFPEIVEPLDWTVEGVPNKMLAAISFQSQVMRVPLGDSDADLLVRNQQMGHARWSPESINPKLTEQAPMSLLKAVEAARINLLLGSRGIDTSTQTISESEAGVLAEAGATFPLMKQIENITSLLGSGDASLLGPKLLGEDLFKKLDEFVVDKFREKRHEADYRKIPLENIASFDRFTVEIASFLQGWLGEPEANKKNESSPPNPEGDRIAAEMIIGKMIRREIGLKPSHISGGPARWGTMSIVRVDLDMNFSTKIPAPKRASTDVGHLPRYMHRYCSDQRIFSRKRIRPEETGTVLIDVSGSMHLGDHHVEKLVMEVPSAKIALYSGNDDEKTGKLIVVADKKRKVRNVSAVRHTHLDELNIIDGPSLEWLGKQPEPRYWISDGRVTGYNESLSDALFLDAVRLCRIFRIRRMDGLKELLEAIQKGKE